MVIYMGFKDKGPTDVQRRLELLVENGFKRTARQYERFVEDGPRILYRDSMDQVLLMGYDLGDFLGKIPPMVALLKRVLPEFDPGYLGADNDGFDFDAEEFGSWKGPVERALREAMEE